MQLISEIIFLKTFSCRSITNIILDYSEDYKPLFDKVIKEFKSLLIDDEGYNEIFQHSIWHCSGVNVNYTALERNNFNSLTRNCILEGLSGHKFTSKFLTVVKLNRKIKEYDYELDKIFNKNNININDEVSDLQTMLACQILNSRYDKIFSSVLYLQKIDLFNL